MSVELFANDIVDNTLVGLMARIPHGSSGNSFIKVVFNENNELRYKYIGSPKGSYSEYFPNRKLPESMTGEMPLQLTEIYKLNYLVKKPESRIKPEIVRIIAYHKDLETDTSDYGFKERFEDWKYAFYVNRDGFGVRSGCALLVVVGASLVGIGVPLLYYWLKY